MTGIDTSVIVSPAAASTFSVAGYPSPTNAGLARNFTVTAMDPYGNLATGYTGTVHFTNSDSTATLPANYTFKASDAGVHTFVNGVKLRKRGTQTLTVTDTQNSSLTATDSIVVV